MDQEKTKTSSTNQEIMTSTQTRVVLSNLRSAEFEPALLWHRVNDDAELLNDLVEIFAQQGPELLAEIEASIDEGSHLRLKRAGHKMKGSALQLSAPGVAALASKLEELAEKESLDGARDALANLRTAIQTLMEKLRLMSAAARPH